MGVSVSAVDQSSSAEFKPTFASASTDDSIVVHVTLHVNRKSIGLRSRAYNMCRDLC